MSSTLRRKLTLEGRDAYITQIHDCLWLPLKRNETPSFLENDHGLHQSGFGSCLHGSLDLLVYACLS